MEVTSVAEYVNNDKFHKRHDMTVNGKCSQCGGCCGNILPLTDYEVAAIHRYINQHDIQEYRHIIPLADDAIDMTCPFLDESKPTEKCRIYPVRPMICRRFVCNRTFQIKADRVLFKQPRHAVDMRQEFYGSK